MEWMTLLTKVWQIITNPTILACIIGLVISGYIYIGKMRVEHTLTKTQSELALANSNLTVVRTNEKTLTDVIKKMNESQDNLKMSVKALQQQVRDERSTTEKWVKYCSDKPTDITQVPVKPQIEKGVIVDEKSSSKYINFFNGMFKSK
jgi:hypothetical protein